MPLFRTKPVLKQAINWAGGDHEILSRFCGRNWARAGAIGNESWPSEIPDKEEVMIFNTAELTWLPVPTGWWIIRGINGELYPCAPDIFAASYEPAEP